MNTELVNRVNILKTENETLKQNYELEIGKLSESNESNLRDQIDDLKLKSEAEMNELNRNLSDLKSKFVIVNQKLAEGEVEKQQLADKLQEAEAMTNKNSHEFNEYRSQLHNKMQEIKVFFYLLFLICLGPPKKNLFRA